jgi:hypothetical protein
MGWFRVLWLLLIGELLFLCLSLCWPHHFKCLSCFGFFSLFPFIIVEKLTIFVQHNFRPIIEVHTSRPIRQLVAKAVLVWVVHPFLDPYRRSLLVEKDGARAFRSLSKDFVMQGSQRLDRPENGGWGWRLQPGRLLLSELMHVHEVCGGRAG